MMSLGSDHKHDYPERDWRRSKSVGPAGKERRSGFLIRRVFVAPTNYMESTACTTEKSMCLECA
jgi:hypothetical protein